MRSGAEYQIHVEQLKLSARVGVSIKERAKFQKLIANITVWPAGDLRDVNDTIKSTVDYSALSNEAQEFVRQQSPKLIETLANQLAAHLLRRFAVLKIIVEIRKFVLKDAAYASVTVVRHASFD